MIIHVFRLLVYSVYEHASITPIFKELNLPITQINTPFFSWITCMIMLSRDWRERYCSVFVYIHTQTWYHLSLSLSLSIFYSSERIFYLFERFFYSFERFTYSSERIFYLFERFFYSFERFIDSSERRNIFFYLASLRRRTYLTFVLFLTKMSFAYFMYVIKQNYN